ncbi:MarR family transcriptional regulator [Tersicoccus solisilvae]|uniref:MarR family transcriptional regulator n=1 Tax=Tersicoccus solisilvae TaxID=1882339 RepID=A0ABQ1NNY4_9MICC|nr:MarR family transcriptional regulator [Tersicoccus solisilvae]GGC80103.1 MarR family transcriptional regulator [Tersicoccus solisilvae]
MVATWLDAQERDAWLAFLFTSMLVPAELDKQLQRAGRLSFFDYSVLAHLSEARDRTRTMSDLAACTSSSLSRLSHVVTKLEKRDWVERSASAEDGRVTVARLTDDGFALLAALAPRHVARVRELVFDALDERDVHDLDRVSRKMLANIDEDHWFFRRDED